MAFQKLKFRWVAGQFVVCRLPADAPIPAWSSSGPFTSVTRTADELSVVCLAENLPPGVHSESHWRCFKLEGPFTFAQVGILASFIGPLAASGVPIFAISTYDTDYVLIQEKFAGKAVDALREAGHEFSSALSG